MSAIPKLLFLTLIVVDILTLFVAPSGDVVPTN
jgi:hypothetical protein